MSKRLAIAFAVIVVVLLIIAARSAHNEPLILVDAACSTRPPANPCATQRCEAKTDNRSYT